MNSRCAVIKIRLTPDEALSWKHQAAAGGLTVADWVRMRVGLAKQNRQERKATDELVLQIVRLCNVLNGMARQVREEHGSAQVLHELIQLRAVFLALVDEVDDAD